MPDKAFFPRRRGMRTNDDRHCEKRVRPQTLVSGELSDEAIPRLCRRRLLRSRLS